jgi:hypothetical protein
LRTTTAKVKCAASPFATVIAAIVVPVFDRRIATRQCLVSGRIAVSQMSVPTRARLRLAVPAAGLLAESVR